MKYIQTLLLSLLISYTVVGQEESHLANEHKFYIKSLFGFDPLLAGIRNNNGNPVLNSKNNGIVYINRDVQGDTFIQSKNDEGSTFSIASFLKNGNVGIGTDSPEERLHVYNGTASIEGNIGVPTVNHWKTGSHTLELQNNDEGEVILSFHRAGASNAAIVHTTDGGISFRGAGNPTDQHFKINKNGNIGVGTTNPTEKLTINGNIEVGYNQFLKGNREDGNKSNLIGYESGGVNILSISENSSVPSEVRIYAPIDQNQGVNIYGIDKSIAFFRNDGNVGIGTKDTKGFKLGVNGKIAATEVKVALYNNWPDYVFENEYVLPTLKEVESHITEKGHLKGIPSAAEVAENGIMLGSMNAKLLQKIEELTLYTIAQEKEIEDLQSVKVKNEELEIRLAKLEALLLK